MRLVAEGGAAEVRDGAGGPIGLGLFEREAETVAASFRAESKHERPVISSVPVGGGEGRGVLNSVGIARMRAAIPGVKAKPIVLLQHSV